MKGGRAERGQAAGVNTGPGFLRNVSLHRSGCIRKYSERTRADKCRVQTVVRVSDTLTCRGGEIISGGASLATNHRRGPINRSLRGNGRRRPIRHGNRRRGRGSGFLGEGELL